MQLRTLHESDYPAVCDALHSWWDTPGLDTPEAARERALLVPRLFLQHFADTSLYAEEAGALRGFLIGFLSQSRLDEAYIHFVGVAPDARRAGLGSQLYQRFFEIARAAKRERVGAITSPENQRSVRFHRAMGFEVQPGDLTFDGVSAKRDYDGRGVPRVVFVKRV